MNILFIFCLLTPSAALSLRSIPMSLRESALTIPQNKPIDVNIDIIILETEMDFTREMLTLFGKLTLKWFDSRKSWTIKDETDDDFFMVEAGQDYSLFRELLSGVWKPGVYQHLHYLTFKDGPRYMKDRISFSNTGNITLDCRFAIPINCNSINNNYPFDVYSCWFNLPDFTSNNTIKYNTNQMLRVIDSTKHEGHEIVSTFSETKLEQFLFSQRKLDQLFSEPAWIWWMNFKTEVKRSSSRLVVTVLTPTIVICLLDAAFFVFASSLLFKCSMIPAYFILFEDIHQINTIFDWPPLVCFFFARLFSTCILCSLSLVSLIYKKKSGKQEDTVTELQPTKFQKIRELLKKIPTRTSYRLISITILTVMLYIAFSINWRIFRDRSTPLMYTMG